MVPLFYSLDTNIKTKPYFREMLLVPLYISTAQKHYTAREQQKLLIQMQVRKLATKCIKVLPCFYEPFLLHRSETFINVYI